MKTPTKRSVTPKKAANFSYYFFIIGCQFNYYDAAHLSHELSALGGQRVAKSDSADLIIMLACSVRQKAADRVLGQIRNWRKLDKHPKIIISACILPTDRPRISRAADKLIEMPELRRDIKKIIASLGFTSRKQDCGTDHALCDLQKADPRSAYLAITEGCNNFCAFCAVPHTRGQEKSFAAAAILKEAQGLVEQGIEHIILLGQNVNSYGLSKFTPRDLRKNRSPLGKAWTPQHQSPFVKLLYKLSEIDKLAKISFLSPNPQDMSDDLIEWMRNSGKFSKILNLPLQAGSNIVLKRMNRRYSQGEYLELVRKIRDAVPDIYLSTDIIVGFPSETDKDFEETVGVVKLCRFDKAYIAMYSPRTGTTSARLYKNDVPAATKKKRWQRLNRMINKFAQ